MRLVFWNCGGGFRAKRHHIEDWQPDLTIVAETTRADAEQPVLGSTLTEAAWVGDSTGKGLAVLGRPGSVTAHALYDEQIRFVLPVLVEGTSPLLVLAVWTQGDPRSSRHAYVGWVHDAVDRYSDLLVEHDTMIVGDFNANAVWDARHRGFTHSDLVSRLSALGIVSLHHHRRNEAHGHKTTPTFFHRKKPEQPFHIDYCFVSKGLVERVTAFEIGRPDPWLKRSDHMPLFVEIDRHLP